MTITPTFGHSSEGLAFVPREAFGVSTEFKDWTSLGLHIKGTDPMRFVLWNGHRFETVEGRFDDEVSPHNLLVRYERDPIQPPEYLAHLYYPIDPRMVEKDIVGATVAYPNETNDGWLFRHCDNDAMVDYEKELAAAVIGEFAEAIDGAQIKVNEATNDAVKILALTGAQIKVNEATNDAVKILARTRHAALVDFRNAAVESIVAWARTKHIGWQEQNPHEAHVHTPALQAIETVARAWQMNRSADYSRVSASVADIIKGLAKPPHTYETRWDMEARIEAERKAAEAEAPEGDDQT